MAQSSDVGIKEEAIRDEFRVKGKGRTVERSNPFPGVLPVGKEQSHHDLM